MRSCKVLPQSSVKLHQLYPLPPPLPPSSSSLSPSHLLPTTTRRILHSRPHYSSASGGGGGGQAPQNAFQKPPRSRASSAAPPIKEEDPTRNNEERFHIDSSARRIKTAAGDLPLSPIMDPSFWEARQRHQTLKPKPGKAQNSVERQFRANPFAKALATSSRYCAATKIRVPNFFLQDFNLVEHPETNQPWWVPYSLLHKQYGSRSSSVVEEEQDWELHGKGDDISESMQEAERKAAEREDEEELDEEEEEEGGEAEATTTNSETPQSQLQQSRLTPSSNSESLTPYGPSAYILARQDLLAYFVERRHQSRSAMKMSPKSLFAASSSRYKTLGAKAVWREDMDVYVRDLMRQQIADHLVYLAGLCRDKGRHYVVRCFGWADAEFKHKGSILWFGEPRGGEGEGERERERGEGEEGRMERTGSGPGPFATLDTQTRNLRSEVHPISVPVHNMPALLGDDLASHVREEARGLFDADPEHGAIFMMAGRRTAELQAMLWKLQGYLADFRDLP